MFGNIFFQTDLPFGLLLHVMTHFQQRFGGRKDDRFDGCWRNTGHGSITYGGQSGVSCDDGSFEREACGDLTYSLSLASFTQVDFITDGVLFH
jgi:hypothetical protein